MDFSTLDFSTLDFVFIKDCVLIALCAACALYCAMLSRRLKALSNMRSGVGASIISLTEAIETTHQASQASRRDITNSIQEMQDLILQADGKANALEARMMEIRRDIKMANEVAHALDSVVNSKAPAAIDRIRVASDKLIELARTQKANQNKSQASNDPAKVNS